MPKGQLYINGYDAYEKWGLSMDNTSLSALMTPAGTKENLKSSSRLEHGERFSKNNVRLSARSVNLIVQICAKTESQFFAYYESFCNELAKGYLYVITSFQPNICYRFEYNSCTAFSQFMRGIGKFTLKLTENNPTDRTLPKITVSNGRLKIYSDELEYDIKAGSTKVISGDEADIINDYGIDAYFNMDVLYGDIPIEPEKVSGTFKTNNVTEDLELISTGNGYLSYIELENGIGTISAFEYTITANGKETKFQFNLFKRN